MCVHHGLGRLEVFLNVVILLLLGLHFQGILTSVEKQPFINYLGEKMKTKLKKKINQEEKKKEVY